MIDGTTLESFHKLRTVADVVTFGRTGKWLGDRYWAEAWSERIYLGTHQRSLSKAFRQLYFDVSKAKSNQTPTPADNREGDVRDG